MIVQLRALDSFRGKLRLGKLRPTTVDPPWVDILHHSMWLTPEMWPISKKSLQDGRAARKTIRRRQPAAHATMDPKRLMAADTPRTPLPTPATLQEQALRRESIPAHAIPAGALHVEIGCRADCWSSRRPTSRIRCCSEAVPWAAQSIETRGTWADSSKSAPRLLLRGRRGGCRLKTEQTWRAGPGDAADGRAQAGMDHLDGGHLNGGHVEAGVDGRLRVDCWGTIRGRCRVHSEPLQGRHAVQPGWLWGRFGVGPGSVGRSCTQPPQTLPKWSPLEMSARRAR